MPLQLFQSRGHKNSPGCITLMYCNEYILGGQPNDGWQLCSPLKLHADGSDFRLYDGSNLMTYLLMRWLGYDVWAVVRPTGVYLLDFYCSRIQFYVLLGPYLCFIRFLILDLYVLGDDALVR